MTVDIVLLSYGYPEKAAKAVAHVKASHYTDIHLIVFDNASTSDKRALIQDCAFTTTLVHEDKNLSYAEANNRAARLGKGELILLLNNDCYLDPDCLVIMVRCLDENLQAAVVGARQLFPDGRIQHAGIAFNGNQYPYQRYRLLQGDWPGALVTEAVPAVNGSCLLIRRTVWEQLGGLDESYFPMSAEDTDLCLRVREAGHLVWYEGAATAVHEEWGSVRFPGSPDRVEADRRNSWLMGQRWLAKYSNLNALTPR